MTRFIKVILGLVLLASSGGRCCAEAIPKDDAARQGAKACVAGYLDHALQIGDISFHKKTIFGQPTFRATLTSSVKAIKSFVISNSDEDAELRKLKGQEDWRGVIVLISLKERTYIAGKWRKWDDLLPVCQAQYRDGVWKAYTGAGQAIYGDVDKPDQEEVPPGCDQQLSGDH